MSGCSSALGGWRAHAAEKVYYRVLSLSQPDQPNPAVGMHCRFGARSREHLRPVSGLLLLPSYARRERLPEWSMVPRAVKRDRWRADGARVIGTREAVEQRSVRENRGAYPRRMRYRPAGRVTAQLKSDPFIVPTSTTRIAPDPRPLPEALAAARLARPPARQPSRCAQLLSTHVDLAESQNTGDRSRLDPYPPYVASPGPESEPMLSPYRRALLP